MRNHNSILKRLAQLEKELEEKISPEDDYVFIIGIDIPSMEDYEEEIKDPKYKNANIVCLYFN